MLESAATVPASSRVLFVASPSDHEELRELDRQHADYLVMEQDHERGDYARKINAGYRTTKEPLIFTGADDLLFHDGWFEAACAYLGPSQWGPFVGVIGTNDLGSPRVLAGYHSTHSLVTRDYADFGTIDQKQAIYHEGYAHQFVDDELVKTAMARGAFAMAMDSHVEHIHPHWGKAESDPIYDMADPWLAEGQELFRRRNRLWKGRIPAWRPV